MKKMFLVIIFLITFTANAKTYEPNWELYSETDVGIKYYLDTNSYLEKDNMIYLLTIQDTSSQDLNFKSIKMYFEFDCKEYRARPRKVLGYSGEMGTGEEIDLTENREWHWMFGQPKTPNGILLNILCGK